MIAAPVAGATSPAPDPQRAGPSPSSALASPDPGQPTAGIAWLDAPLPLDAPAGSTIVVGALLQQPDFIGVLQFATPHFNLAPATGGAAPSSANGVPDWKGHYVARLVVPRGGVGVLSIGLPGTICENDTCVAGDWPFRPISVGAPTGLPLPFVSTVTLDVANAAPRAHEPFEVNVDLLPRVAWPNPLTLPDALVLEVKVAQGPLLAEVPLLRAGGSAASTGRYAGQVTVDVAGDVVIQVATKASPNTEDLYGTAIRRLTVQSAASAPGPAVDGRGGGLPDWLPAALAAGGLLVALVLILGGRRRGTQG